MAAHHKHLVHDGTSCAGGSKAGGWHWRWRHEHARSCHLYRSQEILSHLSSIMRLGKGGRVGGRLSIKLSTCNVVFNPTAPQLVNAGTLCCC